ncbi:bifunctional DNA primase/polymerase [Halolactibacillus sp. JCM 19043]|uniref:bifunctional DNA primase/polymerase n=1 Tax=Halolactibacillus sp. JCM 19043 TaxID=1460638 RepID=UPI000A5A7512|nr:bifunctional DNA primase/polymerase [Halolactibacillus sp. JCM 19043]
MLKYIELDGKVPKHNFDTFSTDHTNYKDAAILLDSKTVVVDFDDKESVKIGEVIFNQYPTLKVHTTRGFHLYYRKPKHVYLKNWVKKLTNAGMVVDYKHTTKQPIVVKQNGKMRKMENRKFLGNFDQLPELPFTLFPNKLNEQLVGLSDGQGRNSNLYTHLLTTREMYTRWMKNSVT